MPAYIIPTEEQYLARRINQDKSWQDVYGSQICTVCSQHFVAGDSYILGNDGKFRHETCEGTKAPGIPPELCRHAMQRHDPAKDKWTCIFCGKKETGHPVQDPCNLTMTFRKV
jgi:hypothetical protein